MSSLKLQDWFDQEHKNVSPLDLLDSDVSVIKGIGPKLAAALARVGVSTVRDLASWKPCWSACKLLSIVPQSMNANALESFLVPEKIRKAFTKQSKNKNNNHDNDDDDDAIGGGNNFQLAPVDSLLTNELLNCLATTPSTRIKTLR